MLERVLTDIWLRENEAKIYLSLLKIGTTHVSRLLIDVNLPKATVYDTLESLENRWLVHSYVHNKTKKFTAEDPAIFLHFVEKEQKQLKQKKEQISLAIPQLYGIQNISFQLPKVRMYQGLEGMAIVLDDSLGAHEIIRTVVSVHDMEKYFHDINDEYAQKRVQKNIKKKVLVEDTPWCRNFLGKYPATAVSDIRFLPKNFSSFHLEMNIYDNKVTYITYRDREPVGIIIEDFSIYEAQRSLFDGLWSQT